jgi:membrane fusion protein (multidrug efflux system)
MSNVHHLPESVAKKPSLARRMVFMVIGILLLVALIVGVKVVLVKKQMAAFKPPAPPVVTATDTQWQDWQNEIDTIGNLRAWRGTDISAEAAGLVRKVAFQPGQAVVAGDVLFELNADAEKAQLQSLQAAADLARVVFARDKAQIDSHAISQAVFDADDADLKAKLAQLAQQQAVLDKKIIRAPFAGKTGITQINPGSYVNAGDKLVTLQALDHLYMDFFVPQRELALLRKGATLWVKVDAWAGKTFQGKVSTVNPTVDTASRNVQVEAEVGNPHQELLPGMFGHIGLAYGKPEKYLTIPQSAVAFNPYGASVFVLDDGKTKDEAPKARQVFITTGPTRGDQIAVLTGLKAGDKVVTSGQLKLKSGTAVKVDNTVQPLNDASPTPQEH